MISHAHAPCPHGAAHGAEADPGAQDAGRWVLAASILGSSMAFIDGSVVSVALPVLQRDLGASVSAAQWIVEAYALFLSSLVLVGGALADRFGRRRIFLLGTLVFAGASLGCGLAPSTLVLVAARAVQGIGAALLVPSSLALLGAAFSERERGRAVGTWSALTSLATAIGPALGGWLVQAISWRAVFLVNLPIAVAILWIGRRKVPETRRKSAGRVDLPGGLLATAGLGFLVYGLIEAPAEGWASPRVWAPCAAGVGGMAALIAVERNASDPMLPLGLFRNRTFSAANLLTLFLYTALAALFFFLPFVLIQGRGYTPAAAGAAILPLVAVVAALSRMAGAAADRLGPRLPLTLGPAVAAVGFGLFAAPPKSGSYAATLLPALLTLGLGLAITVAPLTAVVLRSVGRKDQGTASGISNAVARVATLLAIAFVGIAGTSAFDRELDRRFDAARLSPAVRRRIEPERRKLGAMKPPPGASAADERTIQESVAAGLESAFRVVAVGCAGLAIAAGACGLRTDGRKTNRSGRSARPSSRS